MNHAVPRLIVTEEVFNKLYASQSKFKPQAAAVTVQTVNGSVVSFIMLRAERMTDRDYVEENIPHESMHIFYRWTSDNFPTEENSKGAEIAFRYSYRDEGVASLIGGGVVKGQLPRVLRHLSPDDVNRIQRIEADLMELVLEGIDWGFNPGGAYWMS